MANFAISSDHRRRGHWRNRRRLSSLDLLLKPFVIWVSSRFSRATYCALACPVAHQHRSLPCTAAVRARRSHSGDLFVGAPLPSGSARRSELIPHTRTSAGTLYHRRTSPLPPVTMSCATSTPPWQPAWHWPTGQWPRVEPAGCI
jgi:hypothetical protein